MTAAPKGNKPGTTITTPKVDKPGYMRPPLPENMPPNQSFKDWLYNQWNTKNMVPDFDGNKKNLLDYVDQQNKTLLDYTKERHKTLDLTKHQTACEKCCKKFLKLVISRYEKGFVGDKWVSTASNWTLELWTNTDDKPGALIDTLQKGKGIELGGPASKKSNSKKMMPYGTYSLYTWYSDKGRTVNYSNETRMSVSSSLRKPYPAFGLIGSDMGERTGILIHTGQDYTWLDGCFIPAPEQFDKKDGRPFFIDYAASHKTMTKLIKNIENFTIENTSWVEGFKGRSTQRIKIPCVIVEVKNEIDY